MSTSYTCCVCDSSDEIDCCHVCYINCCGICMTSHKQNDVCNLFQQYRLLYSVCQCHSEFITKFCPSCYELICNDCDVKIHPYHQTVKLEHAFTNVLSTLPGFLYRLSENESETKSIIEMHSENKNVCENLRKEIDKQHDYFQKVYKNARDSLQNDINQHEIQCEEACLQKEGYFDLIRKTAKNVNVLTCVKSPVTFLQIWVQISRQLKQSEEQQTIAGFPKKTPFHPLPQTSSRFEMFGSIVCPGQTHINENEMLKTEILDLTSASEETSIKSRPCQTLAQVNEIHRNDISYLKAACENNVDISRLQAKDEQIQHLEEEQTRLVDLKKLLQVKISVLNREVEEQKQATQKLNEELEDQKERTQKLEHQRNNLFANLKSKDEQIHQLQQEVARLEDFTIKLQKEMSLAGQKLEVLNEKTQKLNQELADKKENTQTLELQLENILETLRAKNEQIHRLQEEQTRLEELTIQFQEEMYSANRELEVQKDTTYKLNQELEDNKESTEKLNRELEDQEETTRTLKHQLENILETLNAKNKQIHHLQEEQTRFEDLTKMLRDEMSSSNQKLEDEKEKTETINKELKDEKEKTLQLDEELKDQKKITQKLENKQRDILETLNKQRNFISELSKDKELLQSIVRESHKDITALTESRDELQVRVDMAASSTERGKVEIERLQSLLIQKVVAIQGMQKEKHDFQTRANIQVSSVENGKHEIHNLTSLLREKEDFIRKLQKEKSDLQTRLSSVAGDKLTKGNTAISDLGDPNRPMKIGEKYGELYDNEWTDAMECIADVKRFYPDKTKSEIEEIVSRHLYRILFVSVVLNSRLEKRIYV